MAFGYEQPSYAVIDTAAASTTTPVAAVSGKRVKVLGVFLWSSGITTVTLKDDTTALHGGIAMVAQSGFVLPANRDMAWFQTTAGNALKLTNSAAIQISGVVVYTVEADTPAPGQFRGA